MGYVTYNVPPGHPLFGQAKMCDCIIRDVLRADSGLIGDELKVRLADIITGNGRSGTSKMVDAARAFIESPDGILTLWGGVGNAKTLVLHAIVNECIERKIEAQYMTFYELLDFVKRAFDKDDDGYYKNGNLSARVARLSGKRVLCIDEVDKIQATEWVTELRTELFDKRYRRGLASQVGTVLAMNKQPETCLPEWVCSRLRDGRNAVIENADADMRPLLK